MKNLIYTLIINLITFVNVSAGCYVYDSINDSYTYHEEGAVIQSGGSFYACSGGSNWSPVTSANINDKRRFAGSIGFDYVRIPTYDANGTPTGNIGLPAIPPSISSPSYCIFPIPNRKKPKYEIAAHNPQAELEIRSCVDPNLEFVIGGNSFWYHDIPYTNISSHYGDINNIYQERHFVNLMFYKYRDHNFSNGTYSSWSPILASSKPLVPAYQNIKPFTWQEIDDANKYRITIFDGSNNSFSQIKKDYLNSSITNNFKLLDLEIENTTSFKYQHLLENTDYYYIVEAYDENDSYIPNSINVADNIISYNLDSYVLTEGQPNPDWSYFTTEINIANQKMLYTTFKHGPNGQHQYPEREHLSFDKIPGAVRYELQWSLGLPIPANAPFTSGYSYSGNLYGTNYTSTTYIFDDPNVLGIDNDLEFDDGFQFKFPSSMWDLLTVGNQVQAPYSQLKYYYRVRGINQDGEPIKYPTIPFSKLSTGEISIDFLSNSILIPNNPKMQYAIIDIFSDSMAMSYLDDIDSNTNMFDDWHYKMINHNEHSFYLKRYVLYPNNQKNSNDICGLQMKQRLELLDVGRDFTMRLDGYNHDYYKEEYGYDDVIQYVLATSNSQGLYNKLFDALYIGNIKYKKRILTFESGRDMNIVDISKGGNSLQIDKMKISEYSNRFSIFFEENNGGQYAIRFEIIGEDGEKYYYSLYADSVPKEESELIHTFSELIADTEYYYRIRHMGVNGQFTQWSNLKTIKLDPLPNPYKGPENDMEYLQNVYNIKSDRRIPAGNNR